MPRRLLLIILALLSFGLAGVRASDVLGRVPQGFAGVVLDAPVWPTSHDVNLRRELDHMAAAGVETIRAEINWSMIEPYASWADVPAARRSQFTDVDGLPLALGTLDGLVGACADRGLAMLPLVTDAPSWDAAPDGEVTFTHTPNAVEPYGRFLTAIVHRYGPRGTFWARRARRLPLHTWEVWNEPNLRSYFNHTPFAPSYVALLEVAHQAIKSADPSATIVLGGLTNDSWDDLAAILRIPGASRLFDLVAIHPYTRTPAGLLTILERVRSVLDHRGARRRPILVDEFGWNSSLHHSPNAFGIETTPTGQAANLHAALHELVTARRRLQLVGFDYYSWAGHEYDGAYEFNFSGLLRFSDRHLVAKPAFAIYRRDVLAMESCARKGRDARRCARRS